MIDYHIRPASSDDCPVIARAIAISSGGYAQIGWEDRRPQYPGLTLLEIGSRLYTEDRPPYTWRNCVIAQGDEPLGIMLAFGIDAEYESAEPPADPGPATEDVYYPARMQVTHSWYVCAMTVFEPWRGQGIGSHFLRLAREQAAQRGYGRLSLIAFEQNPGSVRLYRRHGFEVVERRRIVPHPMIEYQGDALLMVAPNAG
jgi:ribosomal protein S18 acetylase RimI-like enzyme